MSEQDVQIRDQGTESDVLRIHDLPKPAKAQDVAEASDTLLDDNYHRLLVIGGRTLVGQGRGEWIYRTGWSRSTLWVSPQGDETVVVWADGSTS